MNELTIHLIAFAIRATSYSIPETFPTIQPLPRHALMGVACYEWAAQGFQSKDSCERMNMAALYSSNTNTIYIRSDLHPEEDEIAASFLVHELVHWLQISHAPTLLDTCEGNLRAEREAYAIQNAYLKKRGQLFQAGQVLRYMTCS